RSPQDGFLVASSDQIREVRVPLPELEDLEGLAFPPERVLEERLQPLGIDALLLANVGSLVSSQSGGGHLYFLPWWMPPAAPTVVRRFNLIPRESPKECQTHAIR